MLKSTCAGKLINFSRRLQSGIQSGDQCIDEKQITGKFQTTREDREKHKKLISIEDRNMVHK